jgi:hypothetical protein
MDAALILAISLAENILSGQVSLTSDEEKRATIGFLDSQSDKLSLKLTGGRIPYGLTDLEHRDLLTTFLVATLRLEGGEANV